jgi:hypothetical protein
VTRVETLLQARPWRPTFAERGAYRLMSVVELIADSIRTSRDFRLVPLTTKVHRAKISLINQFVGAIEQL